MKKITIKDVANEAGVSISTVSNALNNVDVLKPETKQHILDIAKRLNYIPNRAGRNLRARVTNAIGLFVAELTGNYYGVLADTLHRECERHGYELNIYITKQSSTLIDTILGKRVDGAIIYYDAATEEAVSTLTQAGYPLVFFNRELKTERISSVVFDSYKAGEMAAEYLIGLGHRRLMFIDGLPDNYDASRRWEGFAATLSRAGLSCPPQLCLPGLFSRDTARDAARRFLAGGMEPPDAVFAANDLSAIGCMEALRDAGLRVPEDVSVIGCDDIDICGLLAAPLTTIHTGFETQGVIAVDLLLKIMAGSARGTVEVIPGRLIRRGSCARRSGQTFSPA